MMTPSAPAKEFGVWQSERSYRFKEEALYNHAPQNPGIYELVTFDDQQNAKVLFAEWARDKSIFDALFEHWRGEKQPSVQDLLAKHPNLYFSFVVDSDAKTPEDMQDLFYAMVQADKPELMDRAAVKPTGRYTAVSFKDKSILGS
jgi:hypothetical protein